MKAFLALALAALPLSAWSCHCLEPYVADAYGQSAAVAMLRVQAVAPAERGAVHVEAEVLAGWKAELPRYVEFFGDGDCDYPLVEGESYLIFLEREPEGDLRTARCRGNRRGSEASVMLNWLQHHGQRTPPADATAPPG